MWSKLCLRTFGGTLPETNSSHLKMVVSNRNLLFQRSIFRCYVTFREGKCISSFPILFHTRLDLPGQHFRYPVCCKCIVYFFYLREISSFVLFAEIPYQSVEKKNLSCFSCVYTLALDWVEKIHLLLIDPECQSPSRGVFILTKLAPKLVINEVTWGPCKWLETRVTGVISHL